MPHRPGLPARVAGFGSLALLLGCGAPSDETSPVPASPDDTGDAGGWAGVAWSPDGLAPGLSPGVGGPGEPAAEVDVLVVGAGPAGMAAAIDAVAAGASVLVVDRDTTWGGAGRWSGGILCLSGTPEQEELGVEDSPELLLEEWAEMTGGDPDDPWVQRFAESNVSEVRDWLVDMGLRLGLGLEPSDGASVRRMHMVDGGGEALVDALHDQLDEDLFSFETEVTGLVQSGGRVVGATVRPAGEEAAEETWIEAGAVVMATGGFLRNLDLVAWADPEVDPDQLWFSTGLEADGGGHLLLEGLGAAWANPSAIGYYAHGVADPRADGEELTLSPMDEVIWVNADGERFFDESRFSDFEAGDAVLDQPGQLAWAVFDSQVYGDLALWDPLMTEDEADEIQPTLDDLFDAGEVLEADDLEGLADTIGADPSTLAEDVAAFNEAVLTDGGDAWREDMAGSRTVEVAPFYAVRVVPVVAKAFGGIDVDEDGRVVDEDGLPIPGVYAAGELTGMMGGSVVGDRGFTGSLSAVILSGRVAGRNAAAEALAR